MQLQRSLFSFYKVFIRKTPLIVWIGLAVAFLAIIGLQIGQVYQQEPVYNFDECLMQYFNATRGTKNQSKPQQKQQGDQVNNTTADQKKKQQIPFYLKPSYYHILNETSTIRVYLSDQIAFKQGQPSCKIILNVQKIRIAQKVIQKDKQSQQIEEVKKETKLLQQIKLDAIQIDEGKKAEQNQEGIKEPSQQKQKIKKPQNVKNYNQISAQQQRFFSNEHPYMHLTANSHIVYLDQKNQFQEKHNIQVHAIVLSKQQFNTYPETIFGISSRLWRFHGNQQIQRNAITLRTLAESFFKVTGMIKQLYIQRVQTINMIISMKKYFQSMKNDKNKASETNATIINQTEVNKNLSTEDSKQKTEPTTQNQSVTQIVVQQSASPDTIQQLPSHFIQTEEIYPLSQMKLYFHYPQTLRIEDMGKLAYTINQSYGIFFKIFFVIFALFHLYMISALIGLLVRYAFFWITTLYLFLGGCLISRQWGWVHKYYNLIRNRNTQAQNVSLVSSGKMLIFFTLAMMGILTIFMLGSRYIIQNLFIYSMPFSENYYSEMLLKNFFVIELFYFVCCRSRLSLKYFPLLSLQISLLILFLNNRLYCYNISWLANLHMWTHLMLMCVFAVFENYIGNGKFYNEFAPSEEKPRALYYAGYDISWENTLPPIWTYFTTYFDLKFFDDRQKSLINRDYQLLYGRLLGMNDRQQLPEDEENSLQDNSNIEEVHQLNQNLSESNEMSLIR